MGIRDLAGSARKTSVRLRTAGGNAVGKGKAKAVQAYEDFDWLETAIDAWPVPGVPPAEPWKLAFGSLLAWHPGVPAKLARPLHLLDRLGSVAVSERTIGFDGDDVEWDKITEIRVCSIGEAAGGVLVEQAIENVVKYLPPLPGRKWAVRKGTGLVLTLSMALADRADEEEAAAEATPAVVPYEIVYRGRIRKARSVKAGVFAVAVMAQSRNISDAIMSNIQLRDIPVRRVESDNLVITAGARGQRLRERALALRSGEAPA